ncbi:MAG: hypothetical protein GW762_00600 [Candidatus Pacebacteria bacterium]|nr:hypothetical protein [Candidatus Paceibacterota bacterium]PIR63695.1 MAG: hypothetical protein COU64_03095 [Candidatus Pacebacteria bacterium CG10_big_fil_rev_8_21_14_0_10_40_26]PIZ79698.1 MAG: hypothetical protein COY01_00135 [Candidatus Pacebacteria bacterium CG_4_10_14_0_2_um_filter_40_20]PJA68342.1 MAG: hypothetical protein CO156_05090 [Candidatus Pacebacteria bacterium CG_4_9_14_3_um_filter_40_12]PJC41204.1 MAG: hypothetical protein CO041_05160 [Candidatus Pacebacteria bacterium CG_4_9_
MTKQQLFDGLVEQGLDQEAIDVVKQAAESMPDELTTENIQSVTELIDEMEQAELILERSYEQEIEANDRAFESIMDIGDEYVAASAAQTVADIEMVNTLVGAE